MSCDEVGELLQQYLDGAIDGPQSARLVAHLDECRRCGLEAETYETIKTSLAATRTTVPDDALDRLRDFGSRLIRGEDVQA